MKFHLVSTSNNQTHVLGLVCSSLVWCVALCLSHFIQWYLVLAAVRAYAWHMKLANLCYLSPDSLLNSNFSNLKYFPNIFDNVKKSHDWIFISISISISFRFMSYHFIMSRLDKEKLIESPRIQRSISKMRRVAAAATSFWMKEKKEMKLLEWMYTNDGSKRKYTRSIDIS